MGSALHERVDQLISLRFDFWSGRGWTRFRRITQHFRKESTDERTVWKEKKMRDLGLYGTTFCPFEFLLNSSLTRFSCCITSVNNRDFANGYDNGSLFPVYLKQKYYYQLLLLRVLHQFNQVVEKDVSVPVAESVNFVAHLSGIMVDCETSFPRFEMLVLAHSIAQFLEGIWKKMI